MISIWIGWRIIKFLGVALFAAGIIGATAPRDQRQRLTALHGLASIGLLSTWSAGYALMQGQGHRFSDPWIALSLLASLLAMFGASQAATRRDVPIWASFLGLAGLAAALGTMSTRGDSTSIVIVGVLVPIVLAAAGAWWFAKQRGEAIEDEHAAQRSTQWFFLLARAEGLSLLTLLGVYMPFKYALHINLDGGQGWFGWAHGMLQLVYLVALLTAARVGRWGIIGHGLGFVASLVPFGTFVFEHQIKKRS